MSEFNPRGDNNFENKFEQEPQVSLNIGFLLSCETVDGLAARIEELSLQEKVDTIMLDEYDLHVEDVNNNVHRISEVAKEKNLDIILAADSRPHHPVNTYKVLGWESRCQQIIKSGASILPENINPKEVRDSIGYYFSRDGQIFAFPKSWQHPIHLIPNTKIAVSICGEITRLTPQDLQNLNVKIIYNPSREGDDVDIRYRMLGLQNPNLTDDEIKNTMLRDNYLHSLVEPQRSDYSSLDPYYRQVLEEYDQEALQKNLDPSEEILAQQFEDRFKEIKNIILHQSQQPSGYVDKIEETLTQKGILVIRSDGSKSGILNPFPKTKINNFQQSENLTLLSLSIN